MKAQLQLLTRFIHQNCSFSLEVHSYQFLKVWHYHPELELVYILENSGTKYVGDSMEKFSPGEIVLMGKNLPHMWLNDTEIYAQEGKSQANAIVLYFMESFSENLLRLPEMTSILNLFEKARRGIKFQGKGNKIILEKLLKMQEATDLEKFIKLIDILNDLSSHEDFSFLSSSSFVGSIDNVIKINNKIARVQNYVVNNFKNGIHLEVAAGLANMNSSAFSRYFKQVQNKTFTQYVIEIKIGYACKLLIEEDYNIAEVCYESGFQNLSNFNRKFKEIKKISPSEFIKLRKKLK